MIYDCLRVATVEILLQPVVPAHPSLCAADEVVVMVLSVIVQQQTTKPLSIGSTENIKRTGIPVARFFLALLPVFYTLLVSLASHFYRLEYFFFSVCVYIFGINNKGNCKTH